MFLLKWFCRYIGDLADWDAAELAYIYTHIHIHTRIHTCTQTHTHMRTFTNTYAHANKHTHSLAHTHIHAESFRSCFQPFAQTVQQGGNVQVAVGACLWLEERRVQYKCRRCR